MPGNWKGIDQSLFNGNNASWNAADIFETEFNRLIDSEARNTNKIIASNEQLAIESRNQLVTLSNNISDSIHESNQIIDSHLIEFMWLIEQQSNEIISVLHRIEGVLSNPNATAAKEFRELGNRAYSNGWFDLAKKEYLKSIKKNPYDFSVYHSLGNLYFFNSEEQDYQKAAEYYKQAIKFAKPYSEDYAAFSAIHLAQSYYFLNDYKSAYAITQGLTRRIPEFMEAKYLHAQYCVSLNKTDEAIKNIAVLLTKNVCYAFFVNNNPIFSSIRSEIEKTYQAFIQKYKSKSDDLIRKIDYYVKQSERDHIAGNDLSELNRRYNHIKKYYYNDNSLIGYYLSHIHLKKVYLDLLETLKKTWTKKKMDNIKLKTGKIPIIVDSILCVLSCCVAFTFCMYSFNNGGLLYDYLTYDHNLLPTIFTPIIFTLMTSITLSGPMWGYTILIESIFTKILIKFYNLCTKYGFITDFLPSNSKERSQARKSITSVNWFLQLSWAITGMAFIAIFSLLPSIFHKYNLYFEFYGELNGNGMILIGIIYSGMILVNLAIRTIIIYGIIDSGFIRRFSDDLVVNNRLKCLERDIHDFQISGN